MPMPFALTLVILPALLLDHLLGEPRHHPLALFGRAAMVMERALHGDSRWRGGLALVVLVVPPALLAGWLARWPVLGWLVNVVVLYWAVGLRSLAEHARAVAVPLLRGDLTTARDAVSLLVSRDTGALDEEGVARASTESVLENGNDAVVAALFWFAIGGAGAVVLFRLVNTLDAMWGYRIPRYQRFGWAAARTDDLLGYLPARVTALGYGAVGRTHAALRCWRHQAGHWSSP
ncbi:MAG: CobD/CbiB family cobalamin biosynthesis protein, partial [Pseudomonadota bacterium]